MKLKTLLVTVAVLVAACVAAYYLNRPAAPVSADPRVDKPVLDSTLASQAAGIHLTDNGKSVELARQPDDSWRVTSYFDFPADFSKVSRFVNDLIESKITRLVTTRSERLESLDFKDTRIVLLGKDGKELWSATLGKNADFGGRFLKYDDEKKAYLASLTTYLDSESKNWADSSLLDLKSENIKSVEIGFPDAGSVTATRDKKDDPWTAAGAPEGKQVSAEKVSSVLSNLASLRFTDTAALDDPNAVAARQHSRTIRLTTFDNKAYTVTLGRKPEEKKPKPPASTTDKEKPADTKTGSAENTATPAEKPADANASTPAEPKKPAEPEFETIPAGPVFVQVESSDASAAVNGLMKKRAFQISDWTFTSLPSKPDELWMDKPAPAPAPAPEKPTADNAAAPAKPEASKAESGSTGTDKPAKP